MQCLYKKTGHTTYYTRYHVVWIPRYRRKILIKGVDKYLKIKFLEVKKWYPDIDYIKITIGVDHVHLLITFPPRFSISRIIEIIKTNTSAALKKKFKFLSKVYEKQGIWSRGYFVSTMGVNEETIQNYLKRQAEEDSGQAQLANTPPVRAGFFIF